MMALFAAELWPFTLATGLLVALAILEAAALMIGASPSHMLDRVFSDADSPDGFVTAALDWLHLGKVPLLAVVVIFLSGFAISGFILQLSTNAALGLFVPPIVAAVIALFPAIASVRFFGGALGRLVPKDETSAVSDASLVGRIGTIMIGTASAGKPAEARVYDEYGTAHYVMVEPEGPEEAFHSGTSVLLVRHMAGRRFHAIVNPKPALL